MIYKEFVKELLFSIDSKWIDAYVLGVDKLVESFTSCCKKRKRRGKADYSTSML